MTPSMKVSTVLLWACTVATLLHGHDPTNEATAACAPDASGYFEGSATSKEAGVLKVSLNLACEDGKYRGELVTPVGRFAILSGLVRESTLTLEFGADQDKGTLDAKIATDVLKGRFVFGDDSGLIELARMGNTKVAGYDKPMLDLTPSQWREDLSYFATEVPKVHGNAFYHLSREEFAKMVSNANSQMEHADGDQAYVAIDRIANAIGDGHTFVIWPENLARIPLNIRLLDGQYRITAVAPGNEQLLGTRVTKVGGMPIDSAVEKLRSLTPATETKALGDIRIEDFLAIGMLLHGVGIIPDRNSVTYTVADDRGTEFTATLHGTTMDDAMKAAHITVFQQRPLYMQNHESGLWCEFLEKSQVLYCNFSNYENLQENAAKMLTEIEKHHPKKLAIDMRFNLGGDYTLGEKYLIQPLKSMPELNHKGHLFVLVSPYTFSAGMSNAAQFRSQTAAILVGQPIGERPNSYQEAREIRLPNSHLVVRVSTKYYEFSSADGENVIEPDKTVPRTWEDYRAGREAPLEWIEASDGQ
jgi:hypothetical protein